MRRAALFVMLILMAGCGKKPAAEPEPVPGGAAPPENKREPADPNNFAGKSLAQWREDLRSKDRVKIIHAMKAVQAIGPRAADAVPDVLAANPLPPNNPDDWAAMRDRETFEIMYARVLPELVQAVGRPALPHLITALGSAKDDVRPRFGEWHVPSRGMIGLATLGPDAGEAIPRLAELIEHEDAKIQARAVHALVRIAPTNKAAVPAFLAGLKVQDPRARLEAAEVLSRLDPDGTAATVIPVFLFSAPNNPPFKRVLALFGSKAATAYIAGTRKRDGTYDYFAFHELKGWFEPQHLAPAVPDLLKALELARPDQRPYALNALRATGPAAKAGLPAILSMARNGDIFALDAAAAIGATPDELLPLVRALCDKTNAIPTREMLAALGPKLRDVLPLLRARAANRRDGWRFDIAVALAPLDPTSSEVCGALLEGKHTSPDMRPRSETIGLWRDIAALPKEAVAGLKPHLEHPQAEVRLEAAIQIVLRDPTDAVALRLVKDNAVSTRPGPPGQPEQAVTNEDAFDVLRRAGPGGVACLSELLKHPQPAGRVAAARALADVGAPAAPATAALAAFAEAETAPRERFFALRALRRIGDSARPHAELMRKALTAPERAVRFAAAESLLSLDSGNAAALEVLADLVKPPSDNRTTFVQGAGVIDRQSLDERNAFGLPFGVRGEAVPLLFKLDPEAAIRASAFTELWFPNQTH